ncbi:MAG: helix-turn-helix transcriptional regulator [Bacteroidales bacterium]|jgi:AraC-like DNA-binding protein
MKLYIKNMVCSRCKTTVKTELDKLGIVYVSIELGEVTIKKKLTPVQHHLLYLALEQFGFELINNEKNYLIEKLKKAILDLEMYSDEDLKTSYPDYISLRVNDSFISLNTLFSEIEGITIEKYIIKQKIELVKELLEHNNLNLTEIAVKMHYSNVAHLSSEFKSITGLTPLHFRQLRHISYNNLSIN